MGLLTIDKEKCKRDGLCAADCPTTVIQLKDPEGYPELVPGGDQMCLRCGHCVAVCPHGALDHSEVPKDDCPPIRKADAVSHAQAVQFLRSRRSTRFFKETPVEREILEQLIDIARYAPSAGNLQPLQWVVINDRDRIHALAEETIGWMRAVLEKDPQPASAPYMPMIVAGWDFGIDTVLRNAPALVVATAPKADANGMVDLTLALSYLELAAPGLGLGTCWAGLLQGALLSHPPLKTAAGIPDGFPHHYPMMLGYTKARYFRMPERKKPVIKWK